MRKIFFSLAIAAVLASCGGKSNSGGSETPAPTTPTAPATTDVSENPDYQKGLALVAKNDCLTCHKVDEKLIGPEYVLVANKYAGSADTMVTHLAHKIIDGGKGNWGEVPMTPHPNVSLEDAEAMVKYVLLLKK